MRRLARAVFAVVVMDSGRVLRTPRNDERINFFSRHCERSEAIQLSAKQVRIASSLSLLAMTIIRHLTDRLFSMA
jgi:hypothetical protein